MQGNIRQIFEGNIRLLNLIDEAIIYFREGRYDLALARIADTGDGINMTCEAVLSNREYFELVSTDSVAEMLKGILEARQKRDYVLLADLYEMQLANFICSIQELIIAKEDFLEFNEENYKSNIEALKKKMSLSDGITSLEGDELERTRINRDALADEPLPVERLLSEGYSVEFTSCGLMTLKAPLKNGEGIYLHTNDHVGRENFLLAKSWFDGNADTYIVFGAAMGYHVLELTGIAPGARVIVYESDMNILKLYSAFGDGALLYHKDISLVYDPELKYISERIAEHRQGDRICIHYPSLRRNPGNEMLTGLIPWCRYTEEC